MKRNALSFLVGILAISCLPLVSYGQKGDVTIGINGNISMYDKDFRTVEPGFDVGYNFTDRLHAGIRLETAVGMFEDGGMKDHYVNGTYGLAAGYDVLNFSNGNLEVNAGMGNTMSNKDWKYLYYDGGIYCNIGKGNVRPRIGIGARYYDSRNKDFDNQFRAFLSVGFTFGLK